MFKENQTTLDMEAREFKNNLKMIKDNLRGLTISFSTKYSSAPYKSLKSFGEAVLEQEKFGYHFGITNVKTTAGFVRVDTFLQLLDVLATEVVEVVCFNSYKEYRGMADLVRSGRLD